MDRFQAMRVFVAVANEGGFAAAGRRLRVSPTQVTRMVAALERHLGTTLLLRTTRRVRLTEAGARYAEDCRRIMAELTEAEDWVVGSHGEPRGDLIITAPVVFGELYVTPLTLAYLEAHPAVSVRALLVDRLVNLLEEGVDVAVRIGPLPDSNLYAVQVGEVQQVVCASPDYLERYGRPKRPEDLCEAQIIQSYNSALVSEWRFLGPKGIECVRPQARFSVSVNQAAIHAAMLGWGLTRVLSYQVAEYVARGQLEVVLKEFQLPPLPIHLVYASCGRKVSARIRTFVDFCAQRLKANAALNPRLQVEAGLYSCE